MNQERIQELLSDEEFVKALLELETPEEVQAALAEKDVEVTTDDVKKFAELLQKKMSGELSDEELEEVAGGSILTGVMIGLGVICGVSYGAQVVNSMTRRRW